MDGAAVPDPAADALPVARLGSRSLGAGFAAVVAAVLAGLAIGPVIGWVCIEMHLQTAPFLVMIAYAGLLALLMPWFVPRDLPIRGATVRDRVESAGVKEPRGDLRKYFVFTAVLLSDFLRKA